MVVLESKGMRIQDIGKECVDYYTCGIEMIVFRIEELLEASNYRGFPVVSNKSNMLLLGYIGRTELSYLLGTYTVVTCYYDVTINNQTHE